MSWSSTELEYHGITATDLEIVWIQALLTKLCLCPHSVPLPWCDNISSAHLACSHFLHTRTKHIELDLHFVRDKDLHNKLDLHYVLSKNQIEDLFTKHIES